VGEQEIFHSRSSWPKSGIQCGLSSSENKFFAIVTREAVTLEQWHHVALVWDGIPDAKHVELYIDGKLASVLTEAGACEISGGPDNMRIGTPNNSASEGLFKGTIDDIRLYNRVLSGDEVQALSLYERKQYEEP
jgi:hypothetical protein